ncbi:MAG TPA: right-handed parallel beta-helix repeat-containing protein [Thermoanaerobaculia bacterium]|jgi:hypothetical protein
MRRLLVVIALLTVSSAAFAAADVSITATSLPQRVAVGQPIEVRFLLTNPGEESARDVRISFSTNVPVLDPHSDLDFISCEGVVCAIFELHPRETRVVRFFATAPPTGGPVIVTATVTTSDDPNPANNSAQFTVDVVDAPDLTVYMSGLHFDPYEPEERASVYLDITNDYRPATNVVVTLELPEGTQVLGRGGATEFTCDLAARPVICRAPSLPAKGRHTLLFDLRLPPSFSGGLVRLRATIASDEPDFDPRSNASGAQIAMYEFFAVTNTADSGPGSLRQAILDANAAHCEFECKIAFRIPPPVPTGGFFTVQPLSQLPPLNFRGRLDGFSSANDDGTGDPNRPPVLLDGSLQKGGDGLVLLTAMIVRNLAIGNFASAGIFGTRTAESKNGSYTTQLQRLYLGLDPNGHAAPNERGVVDFGPQGAAISNSVIGGNRRSGVWIAGGAASLTHNLIGVAPDGSGAPLPNGASGVFLPGEGGVSITNNIIANNAHFGVALTAQKQRSVSIGDNNIYDNGGGAIDYGLDGPTPNADDDSRRFPNAPRVTDAFYDASTDETVITVELTSRSHPQLFNPTELPVGVPLSGSARATVELYVSTRDGSDLRRGLTVVPLGALQLGVTTTLRKTVRISGDLRGQWISGVARRTREDYYYDILRNIAETSEPGPSTRVR